MKQAFADTAYWIALIDPRDDLHREASQASTRHRVTHITMSEEVLLEVMTFFAAGGPHIRSRVAAFIQALQDDPAVTVTPQSHRTFTAALGFYQARPDKAYSGVDCSSMATMHRLGLTDVLTTDHHFRQAGFILLMQER